MEGRSWARALTGWQDPARKTRGAGVLDAAWQQHLFSQSDRVAAIGRVAVVALTVGWWLAAMHGRPQAVAGVPVALVAALALAGSVLLVAGVFMRPRLMARLPLLGLAADLFLVVVWLQAMGARADGPFLPLVVLASASGATRAPFWAGVVASLVYTGLALHFGGSGGVVLAGYTLVLGLGMTVFSSGVQQDRLTSLRDPLTGLFNRRWGLYQVQSLINQASYPFCVGILDLDGFKEINDAYGHLVGDQVLATLAGLMQLNLRTGDAVVRLGGDEFMLILPRTDVAGARMVADRVRTLLADARLNQGGDGRSVRATASIGLVEATAGTTLHRLIERADACLYEAKRRHNTVVSEAV